MCPEMLTFQSAATVSCVCTGALLKEENFLGDPPTTFHLITVTLLFSSSYVEDLVAL